MTISTLIFTPKILTEIEKEFDTENKELRAALVLGVVVFILLWPEASFASFESSLIGIKTKVTGVILPLISVIGLAIAAMSFYSGNPQAKQHIVYAIIGCIFGFGAQAIVDLIAQTVQ